MGMIFILIVVVVILIIVVGIVRRNKGQDSELATDYRSNSSDEKREEDSSEILNSEYDHLVVRPGYELFKMEDVRHRDLPIELVGNFSGKAVAEMSNKYDPYAIAIYNNEKTCLGYLPKGNEALFNYIKSRGGEVKAYGLLGYDEGMFGRVCVETDTATA